MAWVRSQKAHFESPPTMWVAWSGLRLPDLAASTSTPVATLPALEYLAPCLHLGAEITGVCLHV